MADEDTVVVVERRPQDRPIWQRILKWIGIAIASILVLLLVVVFGINTDPGRRFVADQLVSHQKA